MADPLDKKALSEADIRTKYILPSERAYAYKMKMDAIKHQGQRTDLTSPQVAARSRADDEVGKGVGVSGDTVRRFVRLTNLIPEVLDMVDEKRIAFNPAVELSYLKPEEQRHFIEAMDYAQAAPSLSQAQRMKKLSQEGGCTMLGLPKVTELNKQLPKNAIYAKFQMKKLFVQGELHFFLTSMKNRIRGCIACYGTAPSIILRAFLGLKQGLLWRTTSTVCLHHWGLL